RRPRRKNVLRVDKELAGVLQATSPLFAKEFVMARLCTLMSHFCISLAMVLMTVAALAVPVQEARADTGSEWCTSYCNDACASDPMPAECYGKCYSPCYAGYNDCKDCAKYSGNQATWCIEGCQGGANAGPFCNFFCDCSALRACD